MTRFFAPTAAFALVGSIACSDPVQAPAQVMSKATLGSGNESGVNDSARCGYVREILFDIKKTETDDKGVQTDKPVPTGESVNGHGVSLECSVRPEGDKFIVNGSISLQGGGSVTFGGSFTKTGTQTGISAGFSTLDIGSFQASDCTFTFTTAQLKEGGPLESGRLWGTLKCPHLARSDQNRVCDGSAEIRMENCAQQSSF